MTTENKKIILSAEDIQRIKGLPERIFTVAGKESKGLFDEKEGRFYLLNPNGELSGKSAIVTKPDMHNSSNGDDGGSSNRLTDSNSEKRELTIEAKKRIFLVAAGAIILGCIVYFAVIPMLSKVNSKPPSENKPGTVQTSNESDKITPAPPSSKDEVQVVQAISDLIPGDIISEENIQPATISLELYNQMRLLTDLYKWEEKEHLINKYIGKYITSGGYLPIDGVSTIYAIPANPWVNETYDTTYIEIPIGSNVIDSEILNFGAKFDLSIQKQTLSQTDNDRDDENEPESIEGLKHETSVQQSVVVDSYQLSNLIVCDMLNNSGESIYNLYVGFMNVPVGRQYDYICNTFANTPDLNEKITPSVIRVKVTTKQAEALGDLFSENTKISFSFIADIDVTNTNKQLFAFEARELFKTIDSALTTIEAEVEGG